MWALSNTTPFSADQTFLGDANGVDMHVLMARGSFDILDDGTCVPSAIQPDLVQVPKMYPPDVSQGMICDLDSDFMKPGTDVLVSGNAIPPKDATARQPFQIGVLVGSVRKVLDVHPRAVWFEGAHSPSLVQSPEHVPVPVIWENTFGGDDPSGSGKQWQDNPIGCGYAKGNEGLAGQQAPQVFRQGESYSGRTSRPEPASFGPIPRHWPQRHPLAGTYDKAWEKHRAPLWAKDLDVNFFMAAPEDQRIVPHASGALKCVILNMSEKPRLSFTIPDTRVHAHVRIAGRIENFRLNITTICLFPNESRFEISWTGHHRCQGEREKIAASRLWIKPLVTAKPGPVAESAG